MTLSTKGFAPRTVKDVNVRAGANQIEVKLDVATVQEEVTVGQDKREAGTDPRGNAFATVLTAEQIAQLPGDPEEFESAISIFPNVATRLIRQSTSCASPIRARSARSSSTKSVSRRSGRAWTLTRCRTRRQFRC
jgi:hypothetical protein